MTEHARVYRGRVIRPLNSPDRHIEPPEIIDALNLNTATAEQLAAAIRGVGPRTAQDIVAHRKKRPFESLEDCAQRVGGVSIAQLEAAKAMAWLPARPGQAER